MGLFKKKRISNQEEYNTVEEYNDIEEYVRWLNAQTIAFQRKLANEGIVPNFGVELQGSNDNVRVYSVQGTSGNTYGNKGHLDICIQMNAGLVEDLLPMTGIAFDDTNKKLVYFTFNGNILRDGYTEANKLIYDYSVIKYDELIMIENIIKYSELDIIKKQTDKVKIYTVNEKSQQIELHFTPVEFDYALGIETAVINTMESVFSKNLEKVRYCQKYYKDFSVWTNAIITVGRQNEDIEGIRNRLLDKFNTIINENRENLISCAINCETKQIENSDTPKEIQGLMKNTILYLNSDRYYWECPVFLKNQKVGSASICDDINYKAIGGKYPFIIFECSDMDNLSQAKVTLKFQELILKMEITDAWIFFRHLAKQKDMQEIIRNDFQLIEDINIWIAKISENETITKIVYNFIDKIDSNIDYLLNPDYLIQFEFLITFGRYNYYDTIINFETLETIKKSKNRNYVVFSDWIKNRVYNYVSINMSGNGIGAMVLTDKEINDFKRNYFDMLVDVLKSEIDFGDVDMEVLTKIVYVLLWNCLMKKETNELMQNSDSRMQNIEQIGLQEIIQQFVSNSDVNVTDSRYIGKLTCLCMEYKKCKYNTNYLDCYSEVQDIIKLEAQKGRMSNFKNSLLNAETTQIITIDDIDLMSGYEFEEFVAGLFKKMGYATEVTKASGDQGIDVLAKKNETIIGIQAKCYSSTVGNSAIQEAVAGKNYYNCDKAMVITNSTFTSAAKELAKSNNVILWDRDILKEKIQYRY